METRSPQVIDGSAQEKLEHEIDNENVRVVRGDGVETASGKQDVDEEMQTEDSNSEADKTDEEDRSTREKYASWGRSRANSVMLPLVMPSKTDRPTGASPDATVEPSNIHHIQSALSLLASDPTVRNHHRTPSGQSNRPGYTRRFTGHLPVATVRMSRCPTSPPSPSIRRHNGSQSHPDITMLVEQWTSDGPANHTLVYKPQLR